MKINGHTKIAAVLGSPVTHSVSPLIHNCAFELLNINAVFIPLCTPSENLRSIVTALVATGALGASVTAPHKTNAVDACDELSRDATLFNAVNCLEFKDGHIVGHNTDGQGFIDSLAELGLTPTKQKVVIYGTGGAAKALYFKLKENNDVFVVTRTPTKIEWCVALPWKAEVDHSLIGDCTLLIDCTTIGLSPSHEKQASLAFPIDILPQCAVVATLIYHRETSMMKDASARGLRVINGLGMLIHQAHHAFKIWTGHSFSIQKLKKEILPLL